MNITTYHGQLLFPVRQIILIECDQTILSKIMYKICQGKTIYLSFTDRSKLSFGAQLSVQSCYIC